MAAPSSQRPGYVSVDQVKARMYETGESARPSATRDALIGEIIQDVSRRFDQEAGRYDLGFSATYDVRLYSGQGRQVLEVDEYAMLTKVEYNTTPGSAPTWSDLTPEIASGKTVLRPIRFWPKNELFRIQTFPVDPYQNGNFRLTGLWGAVQPDLGGVPPTVLGSLTAGQIAALQPTDPVTGTPSGWWIVPEPVQQALCIWVIRIFKAGQAAFGQQGGNPSGGQFPVSSSIPDEVTQVLNAYRDKRLKVAMIGLDGTDFAEENVYGFGGGNMNPVSRWSGWQVQ